MALSLCIHPNGIHGARGGTGAQTSGEPNSLSRCVLPQQQSVAPRHSTKVNGRTGEPETKGVFETGPRSDRPGVSNAVLPLI